MCVCVRAVQHQQNDLNGSNNKQRIKSIKDTQAHTNTERRMCKEMCVTAITVVMMVEEVVKMAGNKLKNEASHNEDFARAKTDDGKHRNPQQTK